MNLPWVYMCSPSWTTLPPPSPSHPVIKTVWYWHKENTFNLPVSTLRSTVVQNMGWHLWNRQEELLIRGSRGVGDGRAEGLLAVGYGGQAAVSLVPGVYGTGSGSLLNQMHIHIFGSSHLEGSYVGDLLYRYSGSCLCRLILTFLSGHNTWTTALSNSVKLWVMPYRATQDGWVMVESSDKAWSTGEGNGKPLQYSCLENPMNSMKRPKDRTLKDELPRSVGAQYATGDQMRNNSRKKWT